MNKKRLLTNFAATAATSLAAAAALHAADTATPARPNIFFFIADDMSWATNSLVVPSPAAGLPNPDFPTPNMKRLAATGLTFDRAYVASPSCAPSRAALLTSLYPVRSGGMFNHQFPELAKKTWPDYFHDLGYEVVAIGKVAHYFEVRRYNFDFSAYYLYHQDICVDEAIKWLKARQTDGKPHKPLCFMVGTNWPHVPWPNRNAFDPKEAHLFPFLVDTPETRTAWAHYASAVKNSDDDLGKTYDTVLKYLGKDTLTVFTADNGMQFPFNKWNNYNGGLHEPLVVSWPGHIAPGTRSQALISTIDVLPTLLEAAGGTPPPTGAKQGQIDGISFLPILLGKTAKIHDIIYGSHSGDGDKNEYPMRAVIGPRYKYIRNLAPGTEFTTHIDKSPADTGYWPSWVRQAKTDTTAADIINRYHHRPPEELYDYQNDPHDLHNLVNDPALATLLADYRAKLDQHMLETGDKGLPTEAQFKAAKVRDESKNSVYANTNWPGLPAPQKGGAKKGKKAGKAQPSSDE